MDDASPATNLGLLWHPLPWLGFGAVYRQGPTFAFRGEVVQGPFLESICPGCFQDKAYRTRYHVPDVYGVGFMAKHPDVPFRASLDVNRVRYSQIMDGFVNIVAGIAGEPEFEKATPGYSIPDVTEVRLGMEYVVIARSLPIALRLGAWHDPDHTLRNDGHGVPTEKIRFPGGEDQLHVTFGAGLVAAERFQIDLAVDLAESYDAASLSAVFFF